MGERQTERRESREWEGDTEREGERGEQGG